MVQLLQFLSMMTVVTKENIENYIPHRPPFVMIDNLLSVSQERFESDFKIGPENLFLKDDFFQEGGLIENIAQTCAAAFGFLDSAQGAEPKIGFIGAISRLELHELPPLYSKIRTEVMPTHQLGNIVLVTGRNYFEGRLLLECEMKIVIT